MLAKRMTPASVFVFIDKILFLNLPKVFWSWSDWDSFFIC